MLAPLLLYGCTVGPDFKTPRVAVPASWSATGDVRVDTQHALNALWWKAFKDPVLDRLIELAYRQNLPLQVAAVRILEARAQLGIATGQLYPQLQQVYAGADVIGLSAQQARIVSPARLARNFLGYDVGFDAAWEIDLWGKFRRGVEAQAADFLASVADYHDTVVSLTAEVARTYATIRTFQVLGERTEENVEIQQQALQIAQAHFHAGETSELDVTQATTLLENTRALIPRLQISLQQARNALSTLLGQQPFALEDLLTGPVELPSPPALVNVSVPAELLRRRPDVRKAELLAAAQCARIGVAKADLYPSFSLIGNVGFQAASSGITTHNLFSPQSFLFAVGPQIALPIFNYGRIENNVRVQDARFQQALIEYRDIVLKAAREVEDALVGFLQGQQASDLLARAVASAHRSVDLSVAAYEQGAIDYQRVLDAQRSLLEQENTLVQIRSSVVTSLIALYKALGGGWQLHEGRPYLPQKVKHQMNQRTNWGDLLSESNRH